MHSYSTCTCSRCGRQATFYGVFTYFILTLLTLKFRGRPQHDAEHFQTWMPRSSDTGNWAKSHEQAIKVSSVCNAHVGEEIHALINVVTSTVKRWISVTIRKRQEWLQLISLCTWHDPFHASASTGLNYLRAWRRHVRCTELIRTVNPDYCVLRIGTTIFRQDLNRPLHSL